MKIFLLGLIGLVIGIFVILFGGGGAAIYLAILTGLFGLNAATASSTSLVTALPSLIIGAISYYHQRQINTKVGNQMLLTAIPAVIIGALVSKYIPAKIYKWLIGIVLVVLGINMLFKKKAQTAETVKKTQFARMEAGIYGILGGLMVGVAGMSGGAVIIGGLFLLGLQDFQATATSTYVLVFMTITGAIFHIADGRVDWTAGLPLMIGAILGAIIAPRLAQILAKTKITRYMKPTIGILLILLGAKSLL